MVTPMTFMWSMAITCTLKCTGPLYIEKPETIVPKIRGRDYNSTLVVFQEKVSVVVATRSRWVNYCYDGGSIDPNTGCDQDHSNVLPSKEEAIEWTKRGKCNIGHICRPDGDCWGSDASKCKDSTMKTWVKSSEHRWIGSRYFYFPYHTCVSSWKCNYLITSFPIRLVGDKAKPELVTSSQTGDDLPLQSVDGYKTPNGETIIYFVEAVKSPRTIREVPVSCFDNGESIMCMTHNSNGVPQGLAIDLDRKSLCGYNTNYHLCVNSAMEVIINKKTTKYIGTKEGFDNNTSFKAASEIDLRETVMDLRITQMQSQYNALENSKSIGQLQDIVLKMAQSISKIDDHLVGNLLNKKMTTSWINADFFKMCDSLDSEIPSNTNCKGSAIYKHGRTGRRTKDHLCFPINKERLRMLKIFSKPDIRVDEVLKTSYTAAHEDLEGWSWVSMNVEKVIESVGSTSKRDESEINQTVVDTNSWIFGPIFSWFVALTTPVAWISLLIAACGRK
uniref:Hemagglutinin n=1 Tax=Phasmatodean orthomyxo-related virus OKIAV172 TaxID=2746281 RepID=A0A7D7JZL7_9ORTO|nr:hemagglutinin [Phasmatodean orthomyxo-related virus OKIAV172]